MLEQHQIRDIEELIRHVKAGNRVEYLFFWGHQLEPNGTVSKSCLSNWYPAPFMLNGIRYVTTEHYMMAQKAELFGDPGVHHAIMQAGTPKEAKQLGRKVSGFDGSVWDAHRMDIMVEGNESKFTQNAALGQFLLSTGDAVLVEASPHDSIWGIGMPEHHPSIQDPTQWSGLNLMGFALMEVRGRLHCSAPNRCVDTE